MLNWISRFWRTSVIGSFLAGLLFILPIVLTMFIVAYIVGFVRGAIGPSTVLGDLLTQGGNYILGGSQDTLAFWLGVSIALGGIWLLGLIVKTRAKSIIQSYLDRLFSRVPLIRSIYSPVSRVVRLATDRSGAPGDLSGMSVVSCRFSARAPTASMCSPCWRASNFTSSRGSAVGSSTCPRRQSRCQVALFSSPTRPSHPFPI